MKGNIFSTKILNKNTLKNKKHYCIFVDKRFQKNSTKIDKSEINMASFTKGKYGKREIIPDIIPLSHPVRPLLEEDADLIYHYPSAYSYVSFESNKIEEEKKKRFETQFALFRSKFELPIIEEYQKILSSNQEKTLEEKKEKRMKDRESNLKESFSLLSQDKPEMLKIAKELLENKFEIVSDILDKIRDPNWDKYEQINLSYILNQANLDLATYHENTSGNWFEELDSGVKYDKMDLDTSNESFGFRDRGYPSNIPALEEDSWKVQEYQKQLTLRNALFEHGLLPRGLRGGILPEYLVESWMEADLETLAMKPNQVINIFRGRNDRMWKKSWPARSLEFKFFTESGKEVDFEKLLKIQMKRLKEGFSKISIGSEYFEFEDEEDWSQSDKIESIFNSEDEYLSQDSEELANAVDSGSEDSFESGVADLSFLHPKQYPLKKSNENSEHQKREYTNRKEKIVRVELSEIHQEIKEEYEEWAKTDEGKIAHQLLLKDPISNPIFLERHLASHFPYAITKSDSMEGFLDFKSMIDKVLYLVTGENEAGEIDADPFKREREQKKENERLLHEAGKVDRKKYAIEIKTHDFIEPHSGVNKKKKEYWKRKVVMKIWLPSLNLPKLVYKRVTELAGKRYTPNDQILYLPAEIYPNQAQNQLYLLGLVKKLLTEAYLAHPHYVPTLQEQSPSFLFDLHQEKHSKFLEEQLFLTAKHRDAVIFRLRNLPDPFNYKISSNLDVSHSHLKHLINKI